MKTKSKKKTAPTWAPRDNAEAMREGWAIFDSTGSDHGPIQLQMDDEAGVFDADEDAWRFVTYRAKMGSPFHKRALEYLKAAAPEEYVRVTGMRLAALAG